MSNHDGHIEGMPKGLDYPNLVPKDLIDDFKKQIIDELNDVSSVPEDMIKEHWPYDHPLNNPDNKDLAMWLYIIALTIIGLTMFILGITGYGAEPKACITFGTIVLIIAAWGLGLKMARQ